MFSQNSSCFSRRFEEGDDANSEMSRQISVNISHENEAHVAENKILKEQNKIDEHVRDEYKKKMFDENTTKEKVKESDEYDRQVEYRQCLLQQIEDKKMYKKTHHSPEIRGNAYTYSEDLMTPEVKKNMKLIKQQEMRDALDECIREKNALKLKNKQKELDEDRSRSEYSRKKDEDELMIREKAKQQIEINEQRKDEAARQWNTDREDEREQFIDSMMRQDAKFSPYQEDEREQFVDSLMRKDAEEKAELDENDDESEANEDKTSEISEKTEGEYVDESKQNELQANGDCQQQDWFGDHIRRN